MITINHFTLVGATVAALGLSGCSAGIGTSASVGLDSADTAASLEAMSAADQADSFRSASADSSGSSSFRVTQVTVGASASANAQLRRPAATSAVTTITVNGSANTVVVQRTVALGGNSARVSGTNIVSRTFSGSLSQTIDVNAALAEIQTQNLPLLSVSHNMTMSNPRGTRTATRSCTFAAGGPTGTCTVTINGFNANLTGTSTITRDTGAESGSGTVTLRNGGTRNYTFTLNADGSSTRTISAAGGATITLNKAVDGTLSGSVINAAGQVVATITVDASGNLVTSDGRASEAQIAGQGQASA